MTRAWLIRLAIIAALLGGFLWFWQIGYMSDVHTGSLLLQRSSGQVAVLEEGDMLHTEHETATISFYGLAEMRLAPYSTIRIKRAYRPYVFGSAVMADIELFKGRAWSKVRKLLDAEAYFRVRAGQVTANVRGTAFDTWMSATGTSITVADDAVELHTSTIVGEGTVTLFDSAGAIIRTESIQDELRRSDWYDANIRADERFDAGSRERVRAFAKTLCGRTYSGVLAHIASQSERLQMLLQPVYAPRFAGMHALRRMATMKELSDAGKTEAALVEWKLLERDMSLYASLPNGRAYMTTVRHAMQDGMFLFYDTLPGSSSYPLKLTVEMAYGNMMQGDFIEFQYARLIGIDARLDEVDQFIGTQSWNEARRELDTAHDSIVSIERKLDMSLESESKERMRYIRSKLFIVKAREAALRARLVL